MVVRHSNLKSEYDASSDFATRPAESNSLSYTVTTGELVLSTWSPLGRKYCSLAPSVFSTIIAVVFCPYILVCTLIYMHGV
jgi:hypothetical protein